MKICFLSLISLFAAVFWKQPSTGTPGGDPWPSGIPVFAQGRDAVSFTTTGGSSFISFMSRSIPEEVLESARAAFTRQGWTTEKVSARDMLIFTRGDAVAAVLARKNNEGSCVTTILRRSGL